MIKSARTGKGQTQTRLKKHGGSGLWFDLWNVSDTVFGYGYWDFWLLLPCRGICDHLFCSRNLLCTKSVFSIGIALHYITWNNRAIKIKPEQTKRVNLQKKQAAKSLYWVLDLLLPASQRCCSCGSAPQPRWTWWEGILLFWWYLHIFINHYNTKIV